MAHLTQMAFGIMYGLVCGCFISLSPAVAAQLYGSGRLAGLSGLLLLFNLPGGSSLAAFCANRVQTGRRALLGNSAGAPLSGALLNATGRNWLAVSLYSGSLQIVGACVLLYGAPLRYSLFLSTTDMLYNVARFKREPKVFSRY